MTGTTVEKRARPFTLGLLWGANTAPNSGGDGVNKKTARKLAARRRGAPYAESHVRRERMEHAAGARFTVDKMPVLATHVAFR